MLKIENLCKNYTDGTECLKNINLQFENIGLVYIKGPSGSGKTTLLNLLSGISKPSSGKIYFNDVDINKHNKYLRDNVTYIVQEHNLISFLSIKDNLRINNTFLNLKENNTILEKMGLNNLLKKDISQISGGEAKRVEIANSLFNSSNIIICDEPLNSMDSNNSKIIMNLLKEISKTKLVILTGHNVDFITPYADRIISLENGKIITDNIKNNTHKNSKVNKKQKFNSFIFTFGLFKDKIKKNVIYFFLFFILNSLLFLAMNTMINENEIVSHALINTKINKTYILSDFDDRLINKAIDENTTNREFTLAKTYYKNNMPLKINGIYLSNENLYYEGLNYDLKFSIINDDTFLSDDIIIGNLPKKENEILVSEYFLNCLEDIGIIEKDFNSAIGKYIEIDDYVVKIVGYLKQDIKKFDFLKDVNTVSDKQSALYSIFNSGISTKDTLYVSDSFENYIKYDYSVINFMTYTSDNYYELLFIKNKFNSSDFITEDMFSNSIRKYNNIISIVKNISLVTLVILTIIIIAINIDYLNHIAITYKKDFYTLYYYGYRNFSVSKLIFIFALTINMLSIILGIICSNFIINNINTLISNIINLDIKVFNFNIYNTVIFVCFQCLFFLSLSIVCEKSLNKQFFKQFT